MFCHYWGVIGPQTPPVGRQSEILNSFFTNRERQFYQAGTPVTNLLKAVLKSYNHTLKNTLPKGYPSPKIFSSNLDQIENRSCLEIGGRPLPSVASPLTIEMVRADKYIFILMRRD